MNYPEIITAYLNKIGENLTDDTARMKKLSTMKEIYVLLYDREKTESISELETTINILNSYIPKKETENTLRELTQNLHTEYFDNIINKVKIYPEKKQEELFEQILDIYINYSKHK